MRMLHTSTPCAGAPYVWQTSRSSIGKSAQQRDRPLEWNATGMEWNWNRTDASMWTDIEWTGLVRHGTTADNSAFDHSVRHCAALLRHRHGSPVVHRSGTGTGMEWNGTEWNGDNQRDDMEWSNSSCVFNRTGYSAEAFHSIPFHSIPFHSIPEVGETHASVDQRGCLSEGQIEMPVTCARARCAAIGLRPNSR